MKSALSLAPKRDMSTAEVHDVPAVKSLDSFDFTAIPSLNKALVLELARSEYVTRRENIIAVGNSGTGKTHIGLGLGLQLTASSGA